jgi:hypothetical protein
MAVDHEVIRTRKMFNFVQWTRIAGDTCFRANQFRVLLIAAAYVLLQELRVVGYFEFLPASLTKK